MGGTDPGKLKFSVWSCVLVSLETAPRIQPYHAMLCTSICYKSEVERSLARDVKAGLWLLVPFLWRCYILRREEGGSSRRRRRGAHWLCVYCMYVVRREALAPSWACWAAFISRELRQCCPAKQDDVGQLYLCSGWAKTRVFIALNRVPRKTLNHRNQVCSTLQLSCLWRALCSYN